MFQKLFSFLKTPVSLQRQTTIKPVVLLIMDGWGIAPPSPGNVIAQIHLDHLDYYQKTYPHGELIASGESVGLPANEVGNTEVGHLTLGSGRVTYQGLKRINLAIEDGTFLRKDAFQKAIKYAKDHNSNLHLMGILSSGNVHGSLSHFYSILEVCQRAGFYDRVYVHAFTDGRDAPPQEARQLLEEIEERMHQMKVGRFATISGRFYAMDRDQRWDRVQKAYEAIVEGKGHQTANWKDAIEYNYKKNLTDELLEPIVITKDNQPIMTLNDNDAVIFFNFRIDRPRELSMAITLPNFETMNQSDFGYTESEGANENSQLVAFAPPFKRQKIVHDLFFVTMTSYQANIPVQAIAFETETLEKTLPTILAEKQLKQLHMAESEKQRFVSYYFNGFREGLLEGEETHIVSSPKVATYDKRPEMSVFQLVRQFRKYLYQDKYHFIVINIANPDLVAHTGNIPATIKACLTTDHAVGEIVDMVLGCGGTVFLTADHGNAEELITYPTTSYFFTTAQGSVNTDHSNNPVPLYVINQDFKNHPIELERGSLSDVAPTIINFMGLEVPHQMSGRDLLKKVRDDIAVQSQWKQ